MASYTIYTINSNEFEKLAQHYFFLAYQESSTEIGMGFLRSRSDLSVEDVLRYCYKRERNTLIKYIGDYIAGRTVKLFIEFDTESFMVSVPDGEPRADYQAWSTGKFKTFDALLQQAAKNAKVKLIPA
jgi:hypothetical protein